MAERMDEHCGGTDAHAKHRSGNDASDKPPYERLPPPAEDAQFCYRGIDGRVLKTGRPPEPEEVHCPRKTTRLSEAMRQPALHGVPNSVQIVHFVTKDLHVVIIVCNNLDLFMPVLKARCQYPCRATHACFLAFCSGIFRPHQSGLTPNTHHMAMLQHLTHIHMVATRHHHPRLMRQILHHPMTHRLTD